MNDEAMTHERNRRPSAWVDVPARLGDGSGCPSGPIQVRRRDDGIGLIRFEPGTPGREFDPSHFQEALERTGVCAAR
jgi:hypothetical protein